MSSETLANKERDFLELNNELQQKVKSLMIEVESIISKQGDVVRSPTHDCIITNNKMKPKKVLHKSDAEEFQLCNKSTPLEKFVKDNCYNQKIITNEYLIDDYDGKANSKKKKRLLTGHTILNFLKSQITKLQTDIYNAQYEIKKKDEKCSVLESIIKKHQEKKDHLCNELSLHKETIKKTEVFNSELQSKILMQQKELISFKKEIEELKKNLKSLNKLTCNGDIRLNRSLEENEKLRSHLKISQVEEKELREQIRKVQEEKRLALKNSEKQHTELLQAFKKQTQLVDNLKKQKAYLETNKEVQFVEEDFAKLLEWKSIIT